MSLRQILGIFLLIIIFGPIVYIIIMSSKTRKRQLKLLETDPDKREKIRVNLSRSGLPDSLNNYSKEKNTVYLLIVIFILVIVSMILVLKGSIISPIISIALLPIIIIVIVVSKKNTNYTKSTQLLLSKAIHKKYGPVKDSISRKKEITSGSKSEVGNIRESDIYECLIDKYNCSLRVYYEEVLVSTLSAVGSGYDYYYKKEHKYISYDYNLSYSIEKINMYQEELQKLFSELKEKRILKKINLSNNHLLIIKETVLNGYNDEDAENDCNDIELFYNKITNLFKEEKN